MGINECAWGLVWGHYDGDGTIEPICVISACLPHVPSREPAEKPVAKWVIF